MQRNYFYRAYEKDLIIIIIIIIIIYRSSIGRANLRFSGLLFI